MRTLATFRLYGTENLTAAAVTATLGLPPTESYEAGRPVGRRSPRIRDGSTWLLKSAPQIEHGVELAEQLQRLLAKLAPVRDALWELVDMGYWAHWFRYVESFATEHAVELDRATMQELLSLPGDLWLDVSGHDEPI